MSKAKEKWEELGSKDPYFAVATLDKFKDGNLSDDHRTEFFYSGEAHVHELFNKISCMFGSQIDPKRVLDFGCGVGRTVIPLASRAVQVVGVDISEKMLAEARGNCSDRGITNVTFLQTDDFLESSEEFDLVHSFIVFQHIKPHIGLGIFRELIRRLKPGGVGAVHFTYSSSNSFQTLPFKVFRDFPLMERIRALVKRDKEPLIPIYLYNLGDILDVLQNNQCRGVSMQFTNHGYHGAFVIFQK